MATVKIPIVYPRPNTPHIPVTITNIDTNKSITLNMLVDTGWEEDRIDLKYGTQLGLSGTPVEKSSSSNKYLVKMTLGSLKPIITYVNVGTANTGLNVFGVLPMRQFDSFIITRSSVTVTDSTTGGETALGLIAARRDWNKYRHGGGVAPVLLSETTEKKKALFAASRSNSAAYWRNRM